MYVRTADCRFSGAGRRAFTLVELLVVIGISSMMMLSLSAALSSALDSSTQTTAKLSAWQAVSSALRTIERDISLATRFTEIHERRVSIRVPNKAGGEDAISYSWNGAGLPLIRSVNGVSSELLPQAQAVSFSFHYRQQQKTSIVRRHLERSVVPAAFNDYDQSSNAAYARVCPASWRAQSFPPATDADRVDSVRLRARRPSLFSTPDTYVVLTDIASGRILAYGILPSGGLSPFFASTVEVPMTYQDAAGSGVQRDREYRWVMVSDGGSCSSEIEVMQVAWGTGPDNDTMYEYSTNQGASYQNLGHTTDFRYSTSAAHVVNFGTGYDCTTARLRRIGISLDYRQGTDRAAASTSVRLDNF